MAEQIPRTSGARGCCDVESKDVDSTSQQRRVPGGAR